MAGTVNLAVPYAGSSYVKSGITALAGGGLPSAEANTLSGAINVITVAATAGDSVILPAGIPLGAEVTVYNLGAAVADVSPNTGATINGAGTQRGLAVGTGATFTQVGVDGLTWMADNTVAPTA